MLDRFFYCVSLTYRHLQMTASFDYKSKLTLVDIPTQKGLKDESVNELLHKVQSLPIPKSHNSKGGYSKGKRITKKKKMLLH